MNDRSRTGPGAEQGDATRPVDIAFWEARGRAVYVLPGANSSSAALSPRAAEAAVVMRLGSSLRALPEALQEAAITGAIRGYVEAHRALGREVASAESVASPALPIAPAMGLLEGLLARSSAPVASATIRRLPRAERRGVTEHRVATFTLAERHPIAKGLSGGRARILPGEDALRAVVRRIARDTRSAVVGVAVDRKEVVAGASGTLWHCRVKVRGSLGPGRSGSEAVEAELSIVVRDYGTECSPTP